MVSVTFVLAVLALVLTIIHGTTARFPLWIAVLLLALAVVLGAWG